MNRTRTIGIGGSCLAFLAALTGPTLIAQRGATQGRAAAAPAAGASYQVDPLWPKPLPNHWILGSVTGVSVDAQDHIWVSHRGADSLGNNEKGPMLDPPTGSCCIAAPPVLEFDAAGTLVSNWGGKGQGYDWPQSPYGVTADAKGHIWLVAGGNPPPAPGRGRGTAPAAAADQYQGVSPGRRGGETGGGAPPAGTPPAGGGAARGADPGAQRGGGRGAAPTGPPAPADAHVLKFSKTGQFVMQIGKAGETGGSDSTTALNRPAAVAVDATANEVFVADGFVNHRVVVFDATTGAYKRHWGAYGEKPSDAELPPYDPNGEAPKQFRAVTCVEIAKDGMVYVCDRGNNRIQVFQKDGKFVKEAFVAKTTGGDGAVWDLAFSSDPQQRLVFVADGQNKKVRVLQRDTLAEVGTFGQGGRWPGTFYGLGSIAVDSKGNVYTGENLEGKRVQKFLSKGAAR
jgi:DNA-binding beta-propeller fold protein YncE